MSLTLINLDIEVPPLPAGVEILIREANQRVDDFLDSKLKLRNPRFLPSDYSLAYATLERIARERLSTGMRFCEWGCGFGVVACLASMLGYESYGIEIQPDLVEAADQLAADFGLEPVIAQGNFIPEGFEDFHDPIGDSLHLMGTASLPSQRYDETSAGRYESLGRNAEDFDIIYAYPWPGEAEMIETLFDAVAAEGALLVCYLGADDITVRRREISPF